MECYGMLETGQESAWTQAQAMTRAETRHALRLLLCDSVISLLRRTVHGVVIMNGNIRSRR
jgi:hypothetical protein